MSQTPSHTGMLRYMPQLDALRTLAVFAVLVRHFAQSTHVINRIFPWGYAGVRLFYVLSGFLITLILLRCKDHILAGEQTRGSMAGRFYVRRFLRIFPVYYAFLAVLYLLDVPPLRETIWWHVAYLSNVYYALLGQFEGTISHFWTLAVEEQFYLIWPWLMLWVPRRYLHWAILAAVGLGPAFRAVGYMAGVSPHVLMVLTPGCIDALALGGLLAWCIHMGRTGFQEVLCRIGLWLGLPLTVALVAWEWYTGGGVVTDPGVGWAAVVFRQVAMSLFFVWVVARAAVGFKGWIGHVLEWPVLVYLGRISYGIYLFHFPVAWMTAQAATAMGWPVPAGASGFLVNTLCTVALASASWHAFEKPINTLKRYARYTPTPVLQKV